MYPHLFRALIDLNREYAIRIFEAFVDLLNRENFIRIFAAFVDRDRENIIRIFADFVDLNRENLSVSLQLLLTC